MLLSKEDISNCTSEEADPRLIRHAINQAKNGFEDITIRTVDSDVFILTLAYSYYMVNYDAKQLFVYIAFIELSNCPANITENHVNVLQQ